MNVCVFCSANDLPERYTEPAKELAVLLAKSEHNLVWGGSDTGLMRIMARGVQDAGGKVHGVSMELLKHKAYQGADEMIIAKDLPERKATMLKMADAIIMLVGGIGTIDEFTEVLELKKHQVHDKPLIVLNTAHFYDGLQLLMNKMNDEGFLPRPLTELVYFAEQPNDVLAYLDQQ